MADTLFLRSAVAKMAIIFCLFLLFSGSVLADQSVNKQYFEALNLLRRGEVNEAGRAFEFLLETYSSTMSPQQKASVESRAQIAQYAKSLSPEAAQKLLDQATTVCSTAGKLLTKEESKAEGKSKLLTAMTLVEQASLVADKDVRYNYLLGFILLHLERDNEAKTYIDKAVKKLPRNFQVYMLKAKVSRNLKEQKEEYKALRYALRVKPEDKEANYRLAKLLLSRGQESQALDAAKKSIGENRARATELSAMFKDARLREEIDSIAVELGIKEKRLKTFGRSDTKSISLRKGSGKRPSGGGRPGGGPPPGGPPD